MPDKHCEKLHETEPSAIELLSGGHYREMTGQLRELARRCRLAHGELAALATEHRASVSTASGAPHDRRNPGMGVMALPALAILIMLLPMLKR
jgi:hypothetical protein